MQRSLTGELAVQLIEYAMDVAIIIDERSQIRYINLAGEKLSGYSRASLIGAKLDCLLPTGYRPQHADWVAHYESHFGHSTVLGRVREMALRLADGSEIPVELRAIDLGRRQNVRFFGAFIEDLRSRKALEAERQTLLDRLADQALSDALTGLPNRRAFDLEVARLMATLRRTSGSAVVAILDIDHFKAVNDEFGHQAGDEVLRMIADLTPTLLRPGDKVARVGGEEFGLILPDTDLPHAVAVLERLRDAVAQAKPAGHWPITRPITVSIGAAALRPDSDFALCWRHADLALYHAKSSGRNRVVAQGIVPA